MTRFAAFIGLVVCCVPAHADVKLPAIFGDHMVIQRGIKVPFWGTADAWEKVTIKAAGQEKSAVADAAGKWRVALDAIESVDPIVITVSGKNSITIKDVLVGEVWLCSGQSNMAFPLNRASNAGEALKSADRPRIRLFNVARAHTDQPQTELKGEWQICTPKTSAEFSAVAYFFGSDLQEQLNVPIALIEADWGGTRAEAWLPRRMFDLLE